MKSILKSGTAALAALGATLDPRRNAAPLSDPAGAPSKPVKTQRTYKGAGQDRQIKRLADKAKVVAKADKARTAARIMSGSPIAEKSRQVRRAMERRGDKSLLHEHKLVAAKTKVFGGMSAMTSLG
jgi:hypothetical protein